MKLKQLLLLTDGCSNRGISPVNAAAKISGSGMTVNVIGVADEWMNASAATEIVQIAAAGNGLSSIVSTQDLHETVQMITSRSASVSVQKELEKTWQQRMSGTGSLKDLHPDLRRAVVRWMEQIEAASAMQILVLVDTSASMRSKWPAVRKALQDLTVHLRSRRLPTRVAVYTFPTMNNADVIACRLCWTQDAERIHNQLHSMHIGGGVTPTGPALLAAANEFKSVSGVPNHAV